MWRLRDEFPEALRARFVPVCFLPDGSWRHMEHRLNWVPPLAAQALTVSLPGALARVHCCDTPYGCARLLRRYAESQLTQAIATTSRRAFTVNQVLLTLEASVRCILCDADASTCRAYYTRMFDLSGYRPHAEAKPNTAEPALPSFD